jgi:hypothetical protein
MTNSITKKIKKSEFNKILNEALNKDNISLRSNVYTEHSWNPSCREVYHNGEKLNVIT